MHKKLEAELISLAHRILQLKNKDEVIVLRDKARELYEKLAILSFVDEYLEYSADPEVVKDDILKRLDSAVNAGAIELKKEELLQTPKKVDMPKEVSEKKKPADKTIFEPKFESVKIDIKGLKSNQISSKEEFRDAISADKTASLFDDTSEENTGKKTLNDKLFNEVITVGLNDRIAFVNNLFNYNQTEFNRILSQLNTFKSEKEAKDFIYDTVKPDYDWSGKEAYEERLIALIERKFS